MSVPDLKEAIKEFMQAWNQNPKPFIWTATVENIIKKIDRARAKVEQIKPGSTLPRGEKEDGLIVKLFTGHYTSGPGWDAPDDASLARGPDLIASDSARCSGVS